MKYQIGDKVIFYNTGIGYIRGISSSNFVNLYYISDIIKVPDRFAGQVAGYHLFGGQLRRIYDKVILFEED